MSLPQKAAKHFRAVHFGKSWVGANLKDHLKDVTFEQAVTKIEGFNTILALTYHIQYYTHAALQVLQGGELDAHDKYSFDHPEITSQAEWDAFLNTVWEEAETFASIVEQLPADKFWDVFTDPKYKDYFQNIFGIIEHTYYHAGQIALVKKMIAKPDPG